MDSANFDGAIYTVLDTGKYDPELEWTLSGPPAIFEESYSKLKQFVENSLDIDRYELITILYPILTRMYLELIYNQHSKKARNFLTKFGPEQEPYFQTDLKEISTINKDHMKVKRLNISFNLNKFLIPMSQRTFDLLKKYLQNEQDMILIHIVEVYLKFDIYEEGLRNEKQIGASNILVQQAIREYNKQNINYDVLNVPGSNQFNAEQKNLALPSVYNHTLDCSKLHNIICATVNEDSSMLSVGFEENLVQVWSLTSENLKLIKTLENLIDVDLHAEDASKRMLDDKSDEMVKNLFGHDGPISSVSFSPDGTYLLSSSEDTTIRLWNLLIWDCVFVYNTLVFPVWDVKFSPLSNYFATASADKTAKLWATDYEKPLRIFKGHFSEVNCIQFHPNSKYLATGSCDRRIFLWDCNTGDTVRVMMKHTSAIYSLAFSPCGQLLVSGGTDFNILVWNIANGRLLKVLNAHKNKITSLLFSSCGNFLASGSLDCSLKLWQFKKEYKSLALKDGRIQIFETVDSRILNDFITRESPTVALHFTTNLKLLSINVQM